MKKPTIITFSGKARHGKDTALEFLQRELEQSGKKVFATGYADMLKQLAKNEHGWNGEKDEDGRNLLQSLGMSKREDNPDFLVNNVINEVQGKENQNLDYVLIRDARFPNEIERWKNEGYNVRSVHIERPNFESDLTAEQQNHPSETSMDGFYFSNYIKNLSVDGLEHAIRRFCQSLQQGEQKSSEPKLKSKFEEFGEWEEIAKNQDILNYLQSTGHKLERDGSYYYKSKEIKGLVVGKNGWAYFNDGSANTSKPIEFVKRLLMMRGYGEKEAYKQAVMDLAGVSGIYDADKNPVPRTAQSTSIPKGPLEIKDKDRPSKYSDMAIKYLRHERGIDSGIIDDCIKKSKIYQTKGEKNAEGKRVGFGNVAFVSADNNGEERHISIRGTFISPDPNKKPFRMDVKNSDKKYPFILEGRPNAQTVYVFESAIDALSHATMAKINGKGASLENAHRIALHGISLSALKTFLDDFPNVKKIVPCTDNDEAGENCAKKIKEQFEEEGYVVEAHRKPRGKDYNDMLLNCRDFGINRPTAQPEQGVELYELEAS